MGLASVRYVPWVVGARLSDCLGNGHVPLYSVGPPLQHSPVLHVARHRGCGFLREPLCSTPGREGGQARPYLVGGLAKHFLRPPSISFPHTDSPTLPRNDNSATSHASRPIACPQRHTGPTPTKQQHMVRAVAQCHDSSSIRDKQRRVYRPPPRSSSSSLSLALALDLDLALAGSRPRCLASSTTSRATVAYQLSHTHTSPHSQPMSTTCRRQLPLELYR